MAVSAKASVVAVEIARTQSVDSVTVVFPVEQPGNSALVGFYEFQGDSYVLKVLKTDAVRRWACTRIGMREPPSVRFVRRASYRWNSLAPRPSVWPTLERFNRLCQRWLYAVPREVAEVSLRRVETADARVAARLVAEAYVGQEKLHFAPAVSNVIRVSFVDDGPRNTFAVAQEDCGSASVRALPLSLRLSPQPIASEARPQMLKLLIFLAHCGAIAADSGLGLDLSPRFEPGGFRLPNLLVRPETGDLAYIDYFGLAQRDGNVVEASAFGALYGKLGLVRLLSRWLYGRLGGNSRWGGGDECH